LADMATIAFEGVSQLELHYWASVVVYGVGPVGLIAMYAAVLKGAGQIYTISTSTRSERATRGNQNKITNTLKPDSA